MATTTGPAHRLSVYVVTDYDGEVLGAFSTLAGAVVFVEQVSNCNREDIIIEGHVIDGPELAVDEYRYVEDPDWRQKLTV
jgi:hypothetical protein